MRFLALALVLAGCLTNAKSKFPADVLMFINRVEDCNHFAGEAPYSEQRALEVSTAMRQLKCTTIEADKVKLLQKYKGYGEIIKGIEFAH